MSKLSIYEAVRTPPKEALKKIKGGRLSGMTDINPMWRLKTLTEQFGPCGIGWTYEVVDRRLQEGGDGEVAAFVDIDLRVKVGEEWSAAIPGTGGSMFVAIQKGKPYVSDECFKMALTDAISVACKALGFAADVYWEKDRTKYSDVQDDKPGEPDENPQPPARGRAGSGNITQKQQARMFAIAGSDKDIVKTVLTSRGYERSEQVTKAEYDALCDEIEGLRQLKESGGN